ncbi:MAG: sigma-70 family RNA polymerase sigma factor [Leptolyngbya sp. PLA1]|nr:sigma-70 family RNA polymerase sigma factor [Leptolyngbya sp. PLA1]
MRTPPPTSAHSQPPLRHAVTPAMPAREAIPALLEAAGGRLHGLARRLCGNAADAEDMLQDVFLQAFRKWHTFRGEADPVTWLYAIAARSCKARARRRRGTDPRTPALSQLMPWSESTVMQIAAAPNDAGANAARAESIARVQAEIARLPEHLRVPLIMKDVLELSVEDTASGLGLAENTVKTRLHRARLALRKSMTSEAKAAQAPAPIFEKQVCLDLLKAKFSAMDRGGTAAGFTVPQAELCARCRAVFRELDLVQDACARLGDGHLPSAVRSRILAAIRARDDGAAPRNRRGRKPVAGRSHG